MVKYIRDKGGATAVEFALVAAPFLAMLVVALQLFILFYAQETLETAAEAAGRLILTGNAQKTAMTQSAFKAAICQQVATLLNCDKLMVDVQVASSFAGATTSAPAITFDAQGNVANSWAYALGTPGSVVVLRLLYLWPAFNVPGFGLVNQTNGTHLMMATSVFKNEAYN